MARRIGQGSLVGGLRGVQAAFLALCALGLAGCAPTADAGPDRPEEGEEDLGTPSVIQLDGSSSADMLGLPLFFAWTMLEKPFGSAATISPPNAPQPSFTADKPGLYFVQLRVTNTLGFDDLDYVEIHTVGNRPPAFAEEFPDFPFPVFVGIGIDDFIHATDPDGDDLAFRAEPDDVPNFSLDPDTGAIEFFPDESQVGQVIPFEIFVTDGEFEVSDVLTLSVEPRP